MMIATKALMVFTLGLLAVFIVGFGAMQAESKIVPITTFQQVAGNWEGLSKRMPEMRDDAQVVVLINQKGHFNFVRDRGTDLLLGTGSLTILNGQMFGTTSRGNGTFTLHEKGGRSVLVVEAALNDGNRYYLELMHMK